MITDRTETDALLGNEKGTYSYADLNRVENAVKSISNEMKTLGISIELPTKTDWDAPGDFTITAWPVESQMTRYLSNIRKIRQEMQVDIDLPESMDRLNWVGANNIEKILEIAASRIFGIKKSYRYSGEIYAGEELI